MGQYETEVHLNHQLPALSRLVWKVSFYYNTLPPTACRSVLKFYIYIFQVIPTHTKRVPRGSSLTGKCTGNNPYINTYIPTYTHTHRCTHINLYTYKNTYQYNCQHVVASTYIYLYNHQWRPTCHTFLCFWPFLTFLFFRAQRGAYITDMSSH